MNDSTLKGFDRYDRTKTFEAFLMDGSSRLGTSVVAIVTFHGRRVGSSRGQNSSNHLTCKAKISRENYEPLYSLVVWGNRTGVCKKVLALVFTSTRWYELLIIAINMLRSTMSEAAWYSVNKIAVHIWIKLWSLNTARLSSVIMSKLAHISVTIVSIRLKIKVSKIQNFASPPPPRFKHVNKT